MVVGAIAVALGVASAGTAAAEPSEQSVNIAQMGAACQSVGDTAQDFEGAPVVCDMNPSVGYPTWLAA